MKSIAKSQLIEAFNARFYNPEHYNNIAPSKMLLDYEKNREIKNFLFEDVLNLCMRTDICKALNMSFMDIMTQMDLYTYTRIKDVINKENERKAQLLEKTQNQMQNRQQQLLGNTNYGRK